VIQVTRLNGRPIVLNSDLIKFVERAPDTVITLTNGEKVIVRESEDEVIQLVREFRRSMMTESQGHAASPQAQGPAFPNALPMSPEGHRRG
jgi:flagellar protein FlbD